VQPSLVLVDAVTVVGFVTAQLEGHVPKDDENVGVAAG
jgi:hypothetical protein